MKRLTRYFVEGLIFFVPVVVTIYVFYLIFTKIDGIFHIPIPGAGFVLTLALITLIGFVSSNLLTSRLVALVDKMFSRLPVAKMVYTSVKDLIGAFVGDKKGFNKPVAVELMPGSGVRVLGFITSEALGEFGLEGQVAVYLPQSYNFAGNLIVVSRDRVAPIKGESAEIMAFIVSGGISG